MQNNFVTSNWSDEIRFQFHVDDPDFDMLRHPVWRGVVVTLYVFVIVLGVVGNSVVVYIVASNAKMHNVTNLFIASLSVSDIVLCVFSLPLQLHYQLTDSWAFGAFLCHTVFAAFAVPVFTSTLTILLIALDRYWLIVHPLTDRMRKSTAMVLLMLSVLLPIAVSVPIAIYTSQHVIFDPELRISRTYCIEEWPNDTARKLYSVLTFVFQFVVPLAVTSCLYYCIWSRLRQRSLQAAMPGARRMQKTTKILVAIVVVFTLCWTPWNMLTLVTELGVVVHTYGAHFKLIDVLLKLLAKSSSSINPLLYCWLNDNFRNELSVIEHRFRPHRFRPHRFKPHRSGGPQRHRFRRRQHGQPREGYQLQMGLLRITQNLTLMIDNTTMHMTTETGVVTLWRVNGTPTL